MNDSETDQKQLVKKLPKIKKTVKEFFDLLGLEPYGFELTIKEKRWIYIDLEYADQGLLIGSRGETLMSLQLMLRLILYKRLDFWVPIILNVGNYLQQREESLQKVAQNLSQKVKFSHKTQELNNLNSAERRIIHLFLKENPDVVTESMDTADGRKLLINPKS